MRDIEFENEMHKITTEGLFRVLRHEYELYYVVKEPKEAEERGLTLEGVREDEPYILDLIKTLIKNVTRKEFHHECEKRILILKEWVESPHENYFDIPSEAAYEKYRDILRLAILILYEIKYCDNPLSKRLMRPKKPY